MAASGRSDGACSSESSVNQQLLVSEYSESVGDDSDRDPDYICSASDDADDNVNESEDEVSTPVKKCNFHEKHVNCIHLTSFTCMYRFV